MSTIKISNDALLQAATVIFLQGGRTVPQCVALATQIAQAIEARSLDNPKPRQR